MRISTHQLFDKAMLNFSKQQAQVDRKQTELSAGRKLLFPSDSPIGMMQSLYYHTQYNSDNQFVSNAESAQSQLEQEDTILNSVTNIYQRFRELVIAAGNGSLSYQDKEAIAIEIEQRLDELVNLSNSKTASGNFMFSGFRLGIMPVQLNAANQYGYFGDVGQSRIMLSEITQIPLSDNAQTLFFTIPSENIQLQTSQGRSLISSASSSLVNSGTLPVVTNNDLKLNNIVMATPKSDGVSTTDAWSSAIAIANSINENSLEHHIKASANPNSVNLGAYTPGQILSGALRINGEDIIDLLATEQSVMDSINAKTAFTGVTASQPGGIGTAILLTSDDGRNIRLETIGTSTANFANFNLTSGPLDKVQRGSVTLVSSESIEILGANPLNAGFSYGVTLPNVNSGTGVISASIVSAEIQENNQYSIVFGAGGTSYSIFNNAYPSIPITEYENIPFVSGSTVTFDGIEISITGVPNGGDVFSLNMDKPGIQSVYATFQDVIDNIRLYAKNPEKLTYYLGLAISNIDNAEDQLLNIRAQVGARLNIIDSQKSYHENMKIISQQNLSKIEDVDYSRVITQLSEFSFALQAAQQSFVKVQSLSLFNFIR